MRPTPKLLAGCLSLTMLGAFVGMTLSPPGASVPWLWSAADASNPGFWQRLFPGVPTAWTTVRLALLASGAVLGLIWGLPRAVGEADRPLRAGGKGWLPSAGVVLAWLAVRAPGAGGDLRSARQVDLWQSFHWLQDSLAAGANPLFEAGQPGIANVYMFLVGFPFLFDGGAGDLARLLFVNAIWITASGLAVGALARRLAVAFPGHAVVPAPAFAAVAVAAYLFSPFILSLALSPSPFGVFLALGSAALVLLERWWRTASAPALLGLATLLGLSLMSAYLWPLVACCAVLIAIRLLRTRPFRPLLIAAAAACFVASAVPSLPSLALVGEMSGLYAQRSGNWGQLEKILLGQGRAGNVRELQALWKAGSTTPLEIAAGALLSPFAVPRTPLRLWLDGLFDPISTVLASLGLGLCIVRAREDPAYRIVIGLLLVCILPAAFASAYDRTSLLRNLMLPVPVALLCAIGVGLPAALLAAREAGRRLWLIAVVAIAASGSLVFDVLTPRRLPDAATAIVLQAIDGHPGGVARVWIDFGRPARLEWLYTEEIFGQLSGRHAGAPLQIVAWTGPNSSIDPWEVAPPELLFWSAGLEEQEAVSLVLCSRWPDATLHVLGDESGTSRAFAMELEALLDEAEQQQPGWQPSLPPGHSARLACRDLGAILEEARGG